ncbi:HVO_0234 family beta-propeller protein [Halohasta litorea]|uniref:HVO-0234-like beta-propeller domain-containing protein n=1 Tax=Halohasta litorea TaxID=869891 RepID=A0ABD6D3C7_9EURY|nr:hypothetical protein [Halohasta litorea]
MQTLTEKRVFGSKFGTTALFVASETGLVEVSVSADQIGEFGLAHREGVKTVAADDRGVLLGTDGDVLHSEPDTDEESGRAQSRAFSSLDDAPFEQAVAVGWGPGGPVAADTAGTVFEWSKAGSTWHRLGETGGVRAIDGGLLAASDGVYRLADDGLEHVGLSAVRDVAGHGTPLAATADGLFALGNGWQRIAKGVFDRVASDGHGHAHAIGSVGLRRQRGGDNSVLEGWTDDELPVGSPAVDIAYGSGIVAAVTENGTLAVDAGDGWRHQLLGVNGVRGLAIGPGASGE